MNRQFKKYLVSVRFRDTSGEISTVGGVMVQASSAVKAVELFYIDNKNMILPRIKPYTFKVTNEDGLGMHIEATVTGVSL
jgi:hypothetical protein